MDAVLSLLTKYAIPDPVGDNGPGEFTNSDLQQLYTTLVTRGSNSVNDALIVGATIEDLDIFDINNGLKLIDNQDISVVYNSLAKGSRNHLRSFYSNIIAAGITYSPQYISQEEFDAIITSSIERGY